MNTRNKQLNTRIKKNLTQERSQFRLNIKEHTNMRERLEGIWVVS